MAPYENEKVLVHQKYALCCGWKQLQNYTSYSSSCFSLTHRFGLRQCLPVGKFKKNESLLEKYRNAREALDFIAHERNWKIKLNFAKKYCFIALPSICYRVYFFHCKHTLFICILYFIVTYLIKKNLLFENTLNDNNI